MKAALAVKRMRQAAKAIHGTAGEFRRVAVLNFCATALEFLGG
jgi:hypothetical protein